MTDALNAYLRSDYRYHWRCLMCGHVVHARPSGAPNDCVKCGGCCWGTLSSDPRKPEKWYVQLLDLECATCRQTLATINGIDAQMELFEVTA